MRAVLPGVRNPAERWARRGAWVAAALLLATLAGTAASGLDPGGQSRLVRMVTLLVAAGLGVSTPHLLYPDPHARALQLSNPAPGRLLRFQLARWRPIPALLAIPAVAVGVGAGAPLLAIEGAASVLALGLYAFARAAALGPRSRAWERGEAGAGYRRIKEGAAEVSTAPLLAVPDALVPGLLLTAEVFLAGAVVAVAGQAAGSGGGLVAAGALAVLATVRLARQADGFDRAFWTTHGVWADAFRQATGPVEGREPLHVDAVYWAPRSVRPAVWAGLVSLDRRLPLGRLAALALGLVVAVHLAGLPEGARLAALALYVVGMNAAIALTAAEAFLPPALTVRLGGALRWTVARFLMSVRWLPPLALTLALLAWLHDDVGLDDVLVWAVVDLAVAALAAGAVTLYARARFRRALA